MITEPQLTEIRNYLLAKKLPIDILIEVNDHFVSIFNELNYDNQASTHRNPQLLACQKTSD